MKRGKDVKKQQVKRGILWLLVIAVAGAIFFFSSMDGPESMELSSEFTDWLMRRFHPDYDLLAPEKQEEFYQLFVFIVRKTAHFTEFAALGAALMLLIHEYALRRGPLWAWGIGTLSKARARRPCGTWPSTARACCSACCLWRSLSI